MPQFDRETKTGKGIGGKQGLFSLIMSLTEIVRKQKQMRGPQSLKRTAVKFQFADIN